MSEERPASEKEPAVFLHAIERRYIQGAATLEILNGAELAVWPGQSVALVAPSGAGKSTLLHIAGLLEHPDGGEVYVDGTATSTLSGCRAHAHPPHRDRLRLPVPSPAAGVLGGRERHAAADDPRAGAQGSEDPRDRAFELPRAEGTARAPAGAALRRRAAARRDRARGRQRAAHPAGRRADRQSRSAHRRPRVPGAVASWCAPPASPPSSRPTTWSWPGAWTAASRCRRDGSSRWTELSVSLPGSVSGAPFFFL